jgi:hypothetical protein
MGVGLLNPNYSEFTYILHPSYPGIKLYFSSNTYIAFDKSGYFYLTFNFVDNPLPSTSYNGIIVIFSTWFTTGPSGSIPREDIFFHYTSTLLSINSLLINGIAVNGNSSGLLTTSKNENSTGVWIFGDGSGGAWYYSTATTRNSLIGAGPFGNNLALYILLSTGIMNVSAVASSSGVSSIYTNIIPNSTLNSSSISISAITIDTACRYMYFVDNEQIKRMKLSDQSIDTLSTKTTSGLSNFLVGYTSKLYFSISNNLENINSLNLSPPFTDTGSSTSSSGSSSSGSSSSGSSSSGSSSSGSSSSGSSSSGSSSISSIYTDTKNLSLSDIYAYPKPIFAGGPDADPTLGTTSYTIGNSFTYYEKFKMAINSLNLIWPLGIEFKKNRSLYIADKGRSFSNPSELNVNGGDVLSISAPIFIPNDGSTPERTIPPVLNKFGHAVPGNPNTTSYHDHLVITDGELLYTTCITPYATEGLYNGVYYPSIKTGSIGQYTNVDPSKAPSFGPSYTSLIVAIGTAIARHPAGYIIYIAPITDIFFAINDLASSIDIGTFTGINAINRVGIVCDSLGNVYYSNELNQIIKLILGGPGKNATTYYLATLPGTAITAITTDSYNNIYAANDEKIFIVSSRNGAILKIYVKPTSLTGYCRGLKVLENFDPYTGKITPITSKTTNKTGYVFFTVITSPTTFDINKPSLRYIPFFKIDNINIDTSEITSSSNEPPSIVNINNGNFLSYSGGTSYPIVSAGQISIDQVGGMYVIGYYINSSGYKRGVVFYYPSISSTSIARYVISDAEVIIKFGISSNTDLYPVSVTAFNVPAGLYYYPSICSVAFSDGIRSYIIEDGLNYLKSSNVNETYSTYTAVIGNRPGGGVILGIATASYVFGQLPPVISLAHSVTFTTTYISLKNVPVIGEIRYSNQVTFNPHTDMLNPNGRGIVFYDPPSSNSGYGFYINDTSVSVLPPGNISGTTGIIASGLDRLTGIAIDPSTSEIYVIGYSYICRVSKNGGILNYISKPLGAAYGIAIFNGILYFTMVKPSVDPTIKNTTTTTTTTTQQPFDYTKLY